MAAARGGSCSTTGWGRAGAVVSRSPTPETEPAGGTPVCGAAGHRDYITAYGESSCKITRCRLEITLIQQIVLCMSEKDYTSRVKNTHLLWQLDGYFLMPDDFLC
ncbi:hypothetical protein AV530_019329 [Patagioenas fasciata monilis]|uniref:Uncharacterized protein n=1 Tax=Patagioenas fasciata monilis TaxID=372326 RepID=A0A1V4JCQ8_PATFA|nr:hypothetical protein AV530_019329 [Patagioenas fasciata monilis]